jgi:hypothetical protein
MLHQRELGASQHRGVRMISRVYSVEDQGNIEAYKGFDRNFDSNTEMVVLVRTEGELDVYAIDDRRTGGSELIRYLADQGFDSQVLGVFQRIK